jgi:hypothetical protein
VVLCRGSLGVSATLLVAIGSCAVDFKTEDANVLRAALCPPFVGSRGVLVSSTLDTSHAHESAAAEAARMGLTEEYSTTLKNLRTRTSASVSLPEDFTCPEYQIVARSDLAPWYGSGGSGTWEDFKRAYHGAGIIREVSLPGYNRAGDRAIVEVALECGMNCGSDDFILLRKVNGKWERLSVSESATS